MRVLRKRPMLHHFGTVRENHRHSIPSYVRMLVPAAAVVLRYGCTAIPLNRMKPLVAPTGTVCSTNDFSFLANEPHATTFHYQLPEGSVTKQMSSTVFEQYYQQAQSTVSSKLPPQLQNHKVVKGLTDFLTTSFAEAQLDAQIAEGTRPDGSNDIIGKDRIAAERQAIQKHRAPAKLTHGAMKDFADKLFEFQLKSGPASFTGSFGPKIGLSPQELAKANQRPKLDTMFVQYLDAYYKGKFVDRMGTTVDKPPFST